MLEAVDLKKTYATGGRAQRGVSFELRGSEIVAVVGPSGAGKSTLIQCMNRLVEPTAGEIWLDKREITELAEMQLRYARRDMGMIFQEFNLVERLTVMENVLSGRLGYTSNWNAFWRRFSREEIEEAYQILDRVGLIDYVDKRADELSGGQRQRVGIARAVIQRPKILLVDEPTSSLDPETSRSVMELLTDIARSDGIPVLINIHQVDLARKFTERILGLNRGHFVFEGAPGELDDEALDVIYRGEHSTEQTSEATSRIGAEAPRKA